MDLTTNAKTCSLWMTDAVPMALPSLPNEVEKADVCVVGAGISGLSVALCLLRSGRSVTLIDRGGIGSAETLRSSAHLASALDDRFFDLERWHGAEGARIAAESHAKAIDIIERWVQEYAISCDFKRVDGYLFRAPESNAEILKKEAAAALRAGLKAELCPEGIASLKNYGPLLRFSDQARIDIGRYLHGLAQVVREAGGQFYGGEVTEVEDGAQPCVRTQHGGTIRASAVVIAANVPFHRRIAFHTKQAAYRTFVIAGRIPRGSVADALFWDTGDPYHYVRIQPGRNSGNTSSVFDYLLVGGADHKTGQMADDKEPFDQLTQWARTFCPQFSLVEFAWSGQVIEPVDGLGFIGRDPGTENLYVVTGDSGNGLTHGTLVGPLIVSLISGQDHPWRALYDPARKKINATWLKENANVGMQYKDWLESGDLSSAEAITCGEGAVVRHGLHRFALYRNNQGHLHAFSARCPHLGCAVHWNSIEKSWDCPCHGSRFNAANGRVLNGPAIEGLEALTDSVVSDNA